MRYVTDVEGLPARQIAGFFEGWPNRPSADELLSLLERSYRCVLAVDDDGQVVGVVCAISDGRLSAYIPLLEVLPGFRNQGIGTELMRRMIDELRGISMVDVTCDADLVPFYERLGMQRLVAMSIRTRTMPRASGDFQRAERTGNDSLTAARFVSVESEVPEVEAAPGVWMRPVFGGNLNLSFVRMEPGSVAPVHEHSEEQIGFVLEGSCELELTGETRTLRSGAVYVAPPFVPHGARAGDEGCRIIDAFSPPREALRELLEEALRRESEQRY